MSVLLASAFFGPTEYFAHIVQNEEVLIEQYENYTKQTYRNRCVILGPNGPQNLQIPIQKEKGKQVIKDVRISYADNWNELHWRSLQTAYGSSPFFEIIGGDVKNLLDSKPEFLLDLNIRSTEMIINWLQIEKPIKLTNEFKAIGENNDQRFAISPKVSTSAKSESYFQVFGKDFKSNLSTLDLLFNQGPLALEYLEKVEL